MAELGTLKTPSLIGRTAEMLTDYILSRELEVGEFMSSEVQLSKKLGIGRSTLREAVNILESRGLVKRVHGKGLIIVDESRQAASNMLQLLLKRHNTSVMDLIEVRNIIEVKAAWLAAERATPENIKFMRAQLNAMRSFDVSDEEYFKADLDFHHAVAEASQNKVLVLEVETIRPMIQESIIACMKLQPRPESIKPYHGNVFDAIEKGDAELAGKAMEEHLEGTLKMLTKMGIK